jgi:hypothetical protein
VLKIRGLVEGEKGEIISGALVALEEGTAPFPDMALSTDTEGHFTIYLPIGHFRLAAYSQDGRHGTVEYDSSTNTPLVIRLNPIK